LADDPEDFCSLLIERLLQIAIPGFEFLEQPHVLDGDDGLIREGPKKFPLVVGERSGFEPSYDNHADRLASQEHRSPEEAAETRCFDGKCHVERAPQHIHRLRLPSLDTPKGRARAATLVAKALAAGKISARKAEALARLIRSVRAEDEAEAAAAAAAAATAPLKKPEPLLNLTVIQEPRHAGR